MRKRLCVVCTHSLTLATLYKGLFPFLSERGWDIDVVVGDREYSNFPKEDFGEISPIIIPMKRLPSPVADMRGLYSFYRHFSKNKYDVVHVSTPKAALLASLGRRLSGGRGVVFVYRRCVYELMSGVKREVYLFTDRMTCAASDVVVPISRQLKDFLARNQVAARKKLHMAGTGSSNGVNIEKFAPGPAKTAAAQKLLEQLNLDPARPILLFLGRICSEKGVDLLPGVVERVRQTVPGVQLVVAGPDDVRDPISAETVHWIASDSDTRRLGFVAETETLFALCTLFVFPSFFEGFGNVLLEASAAGKVSVAFDVPGVQEAVAHGESGVLVSSGSEAQMAEAITALLQNRQELERMQNAGLERVRAEFSRTVIWDQIDSLLKNVSHGNLTGA